MTKRRSYNIYDTGMRGEREIITIKVIITT